MYVGVVGVVDVCKSLVVMAALLLSPLIPLQSRMYHNEDQTHTETQDLSPLWFAGIYSHKDQEGIF